MADRLAFIDFEASGLGAKSWPVEIGWAYPTGDPVAHLIKPAEVWPADAWDPAAEALHGLSREFLVRTGGDPKKLCATVNEALAGYEVYSDAPDWDGFWLFRLFETARVKPAFSLSDFGGLLESLDIDRQRALLKKADALAPRRHRAADDALHLQTLYGLIRSEQGVAPV